MKKILLLPLFLIFFANLSTAQSGKKSFFMNLLLPYGADPYSFYKDGFYFYTPAITRINIFHKS